METAGGGGRGAGAGGEEEDVGRGVMASCSSSVPTSPSSLRSREEEQDYAPMSDYCDFACQMEEEAAAAQDVDGGGGRSLVGGVGSSLSFGTCSSAPSSPRSVRSLSIDLGDFLEDSPSRRWLRASPTIPSSLLRFRQEEQDYSPMSDYHDFACQMEEAAAQDVGGGGGGGGGGGVGSSLSFRTCCSSAPSSPRSVRSLSIDLGDFPPMSEWEEIASRRWLWALEASSSTLEEQEKKPSRRRLLPRFLRPWLATQSDGGGDPGHIPPMSECEEIEAPSSTLEEEEKKPSRRWLLPPFLRPWLAAQSDGGGGEWTKHRDDHLLWYQDLGSYAFGDYSVAVAQANYMLEDQCQIESGPFGAFVGVYDGHGGPEAARYVCDHLYRSFQDLSSGPLGVTAEAIETAFLKTEEEFTAMVSQTWGSNPRIATTGSCCLVGVICHQRLYVANLGDSRVVLGRKSRNTGEIAAIQLSTEHNVNMEEIREELRAQNPDDPYIVIMKRGVWRIKGIIQISRSIGDAFMKHAEYNREPLIAPFRISGPVRMPILSAKPTIICHRLCQSDSFLIFASDGLWEHLSNQEAVNIVHNHPHGGAAKRLIKAALQEAARKREMKYSHLQRIDKGIRRHFYDDITVIVLFLNDDLISQPSVKAPSLSFRSALGF